MLVLLLLHVNKLARDISEAVLGNFYEPSKDVVMITGGSGGLGTEFVKAFSNRNTRAIVSVDINLPPDQDRIDGVHYYQCDVSDFQQVVDLQAKVQAEVGTVSILINNAAITIGKTLVDLSIEEIERVISINLLASFYTIKTFLPAMLQQKRGYIITVSSVLGYMSPAKLSAYGASKSGLMALHESLTYELGSPSLNSTGVKTLLLCPGQLQTNMFASIASPSKVFAPELDPNYVANRLVKALELGRRGEINLPFYGNFLPLFRAVPWPIVELVREVSGIDKSMKGFRNTARSLTKKASSLLTLHGSALSSLSSMTSESAVTLVQSSAPPQTAPAQPSPQASESLSQGHAAPHN